MPSLRFSALLALAPALTAAMPWSGPEPTNAVHQDLAVFGTSPAPTSAPHVDDSIIELLKRQDDSARTCGYINGVSSEKLTCTFGRVCATNSIWEVAGCCDPSSMAQCSLFTSCIPSVSVRYCTNAACQNDQQIRKCSMASAPYCYMYLYNFGTTTMTELGCTNELNAIYTVEQTYSGQQVIVTPVYVPIPITPSNTDTTTATSKPTPSPDPSATPLPTPIPPPKSGPSIGAIVGGVVGGLAVIGALTFGVVFMILRNRRNKHNAASAAAAGHGAPEVTDYKPPPPPGPAMYQQPPPPPQPQQQWPTYEHQPLMQPGNTASFYQPDMAAGAGALPPKKHEYVNVQAQPMGHPMTPGGDIPSPSISPAPQYTPPFPAPQQQYSQVPEHVAEVGGTPRPHHPSAGGQAHELA